MKSLYLKSLLFLVLLMGCLGLVGCNRPAEMLLEPQNLRIEKRVFVWDPVENAAGYKVTFLKEEYITQECSLDLRFCTTPGSYHISVIALGDNDRFTNSTLVSMQFELEQPLEHGFDELGFEYTFDEELLGYEISSGTANLKGDVVLPDYFEDYPVKRIAELMFNPEYRKITESSMQMAFPDIYTEKLCNTVTTSVKLPAYLEQIAPRAFAYMIRLEEIILPDTVTVIGVKAFTGCKNLKKVTLPPGLKVIPEDCFNNTALSEITFPEGLVAIGMNAFRNDTLTVPADIGFTYTTYKVESELRSIVIPDSVRYIGSGAFVGRENLESIQMSANIEELAQRVFRDTAWYDAQPNGFVFLDDILITYKGELPENSEITIPSHCKGIAAYAFGFSEARNGLASVVIPSGVKLLGDGIFYGCKSLHTVILPEDLQVLPTFTFGYTTNLKNISLPDSLVSIGSSAFHNSGLESITIPPGVTKIDRYAFADCKALTEIIVPEGVTYLGETAFNGCSNLQTVYLPKSLTEIRSFPFSDCETLTYVYYAGECISELTDLIYASSRESITYSALYRNRQLYQNAPIYCYSETQPMVAGKYWHYVDGVPSVWPSTE